VILVFLWHVGSEADFALQQCGVSAHWKPPSVFRKSFKTHGHIPILLSMTPHPNPGESAVAIGLASTQKSAFGFAEVANHHFALV